MTTKDKKDLLKAFSLSALLTISFLAALSPLFMDLFTKEPPAHFHSRVEGDITYRDRCTKADCEANNRAIWIEVK